MKTLIAGLIVGISVVVLTLIAVFLTHERVIWRIVSALLGLCAVVSAALQRMWARDDIDAETKEKKTKKQAEEKERHRLYALLRKVLAEARDHEARHQAEEDSRSVVRAAEKAESIIDWLFDTDPTNQHISSQWERVDLDPERDRAFNQLEEELLHALRARM